MTSCIFVLYVGYYVVAMPLSALEYWIVEIVYEFLWKMLWNNLARAISAFWPALEQCCVVSQKALSLGVISQIFQLFTFFCRYLEVEWEAKRKTHREFSKSTMIDLYPSVPKQDNSSDCGVYLLQYVESFFQVQMQAMFPFPPNYFNHKNPFSEQNRQTQKSCWKCQSHLRKEMKHILM